MSIGVSGNRTSLYVLCVLMTFIILYVPVIGITWGGQRAAGLSVNAQQSVIYVPQQYSSLQQAIDAAGPNAVIYVSSGVYNGSILIYGKSNLTIIGEGYVLLNYQGAGNTSVNSSTVTLRNLNFQAEVFINGSSVNMDNVTVDAWGYYYAIASYNSPDLYLNDVTAWVTNQYGQYGDIFVQNSSSVVMKGVNATIVSGTSIYINGSDSVTLDKVIAYFNGYTSGYTGRGVYLYDCKSIYMNYVNATGPNSLAGLFANDSTTYQDSELEVNNSAVSSSYLYNISTVAFKNLTVDGNVFINGTAEVDLVNDKMLPFNYSGNPYYGNLWIYGTYGKTSVDIVNSEVSGFNLIVNAGEVSIRGLTTVLGVNVSKAQELSLTSSNVTGGIYVNDVPSVSLTSSLIGTTNVASAYYWPVNGNALTIMNTSSLTMSNDVLNVQGIYVGNSGAFTSSHVSGNVTSALVISNVSRIYVTRNNINMGYANISGFSQLYLLSSSYYSFGYNGGYGLSVYGTGSSKLFFSGLHVNSNNYAGIYLYNAYNLTVMDSSSDSYTGMGGFGLTILNVNYVNVDNYRSVGWYGESGGEGILIGGSYSVVLSNINVTGLNAQVSIQYNMYGATGISVYGFHALSMNNVTSERFPVGIQATGSGTSTVALDGVISDGFNSANTAGVAANVSDAASVSINGDTFNSIGSYGLVVEDVPKVSLASSYSLANVSDSGFIGVYILNSSQIGVSDLVVSNYGGEWGIGFEAVGSQDISMNSVSSSTGIYLINIPSVTLDNVTFGRSSYYGTGIYANYVLTATLDNVRSISGSGAGIHVVGQGYSAQSLTTHLPYIYMSDVESGGGISASESYNVTIVNSLSGGKLSVSGSAYGYLYSVTSYGGISMRGVGDSVGQASLLSVVASGVNSDGVSISNFSSLYVSGLNATGAPGNSAEGIVVTNVPKVVIEDSVSNGWSGYGVDLEGVGAVSLSDLSSYGSGGGVYVSGYVSLRLDYLRILTSTSYDGITLQGNSSSVTVINNLTTSGYEGLYVNGNGLVTISNLRSSGGLSLSGVTNASISSSEVSTNATYGLSVEGVNYLGLRDFTSMSQQGISVEGNGVSSATSLALSNVSSYGNVSYDYYSLKVQGFNNVYAYNVSLSDGLYADNINNIFISSNNIYSTNRDLYAVFVGVNDLLNMSYVNIVGQNNNYLLEVKGSETSTHVYISHLNAKSVNDQNGLLLDDISYLSMSSVYASVPNDTRSVSLGYIRSSSIEGLEAYGGSGLVAEHVNNLILNNSAIYYINNGVVLNNDGHVTMSRYYGYTNHTEPFGSQSDGVMANNVTALSIGNSLLIGGNFSVYAYIGKSLIIYGLLSNHTSTSGAFVGNFSNVTVFGSDFDYGYVGLSEAGVSNTSVYYNSFTGSEYGLALDYVKSAYVYLNMFGCLNTSHDFYELDSNVELHTPSKVSYTYRPTGYSGTSYLGNYWYGYKVSEVDGTGIGSKPFNTSRVLDYYPLTGAPDEYVVSGIPSYAPPLTTTTTLPIMTTTFTATTTTSTTSTSPTITSTVLTSTSSLTTSTRAPAILSSTMLIGGIVAIAVVLGVVAVLLMRRR